VDAPSTRVDPSQVKTAAAAVQLYNNAVIGIAMPYAGAFTNNVVVMSGFLTDELQDVNNYGQSVDARSVFPPLAQPITDQMYFQIHQVRTEAQQARQALQLYAPNSPKAWQGQLFAIEGYTVLWLAELFCSGMPLTSVPLVGPQQPTAGFTTQELFTRAAALFDSAIVTGADSASFLNLARVGKGRALLGLGKFADADAAVRDVPTDFVYSVQFSESAFELSNGLTVNGSYAPYRAQDAEGGNGLVWSTDPRTGIVVIPDQADVMLWPAKYYAAASGAFDPLTPNPTAPARLADGLEARLIQAEAALAAGNASWLTTLNTLRATCVESAACAPVPGLTAAALPALADPGTVNGRIDLVMKERAMWLYLTGHREGDLRRLARIYQRDPATLWPTGIISSPAFPPLQYDPGPNNGLFYGQDMVFPPAADETVNNPLYQGCYNKNP